MFSSTATDIVAVPGLAQRNLFVRDLTGGATTLETRSRFGGRANGASEEASISGDGRFVAFSSTATNLTADADPRRESDIFLRDRRLGRTTLGSVAIGGGAGSRLSIGPYVSDDGRIVAFESLADDLVEGEDSNGRADVFVRDVRSGRTTRVSTPVGGGQANEDSFVQGLSADGRYVLLFSEATNLVPGGASDPGRIYVYDRSKRTLARIPGSGPGAVISSDGRVVAFTSLESDLVPRDTNGVADVFVRHPSGAAAR